MMHPTSSPMAFSSPLWCQLHLWNCVQPARGSTEADVDILWATLTKTLAQRSNWGPALGTASSTLLACPLLEIFLKLLIQKHFFCLRIRREGSDWKPGWRIFGIMVFLVLGTWCEGLAWMSSFPDAGVLYLALWASSKRWQWALRVSATWWGEGGIMS